MGERGGALGPRPGGTWPTHYGRAPELPSTANDRHQEQPANMKLARALNPRATHGNTLVMRSSAAPLPVLGPGGPAVRVSLPPDDLG